MQLTYNKDNILISSDYASISLSPDIEPLSSDNKIIQTSPGDRLGGSRDAQILSLGQKVSLSEDETSQLQSRHPVLQGHTEKVNGTLTLTDGHILSWSEDNTLRLWSSKGEKVDILHGHGGGVVGVIALVDGRLLSWSGDFNSDNTLRLWSLERKTPAVLGGHKRAVDHVVLSEDGRMAVSVSSDGTLIVWDVKAGHKLTQVENTPAGRHTLAQAYPQVTAFSGFQRTADGTELAYRGSVLTIRMADGREVRFTGDADITHAVLTPDGTIVAGDRAGRVLFLRVRG